MRHQGIAAAIAICAFAFATTATKAEKLSNAYLSQINCDGAEMDLPSSAADTAKYVNPDDEETSTLHSPFSSEQVRTEYKSWRKEFAKSLVSGLNNCKNAKEQNRITGMLSMDQAYIGHALGSADWQTSTNLALQKLTKCASDYYAQQKGADCQTLIDELVKYKVKWSEVTP